MIIPSDLKLEIGKIYDEHSNPEFHFEYLGKIIDHFAFKVIREATQEEFLQYMEENHGKDLANRIYLCKYFFEIQTD